MKKRSKKYKDVFGGQAGGGRLGGGDRQVRQLRHLIPRYTGEAVKEEMRCMPDIDAISLPLFANAVPFTSLGPNIIFGAL
jgi:hypothetical protein